MTTLPLHAPLVDPKTGMVDMTSPWLPILRASGGLSTEQVNGLSALQFKALLASVRVGGVGGIPISQGAITAEMIGSINANTINGNITANQIGSVNAVSIAGGISANQIGSINATSITGSITAGQIGSINASVITSGVISTAGVVNCASLTGTIGSAVIINAATVTISGGWSGGQVGTATITGSNIAAATIVYGNIATVNAGAIVSVGGSAISATCIDTLNAGSITVLGGWSSGQIGSVNAGTINAGTIDGAVIGILNAGSISITGTGWVHNQIVSVDAGTIKVGTLNAIDITGCSITSGIFQTNATVSSSGGVIITGSSNQANFYGNNGTSMALLATIGLNTTIGSATSCAAFGSVSAGNVAGLIAAGNNGVGLYAISTNNHGIQGESTNETGIFGHTAAPSFYGVLGENTGGGIGIYGLSTGSGGIGGHFAGTPTTGNSITLADTTTGTQAIVASGIWTPPIGFYTFSVENSLIVMQGPGAYSGYVAAGTFYTNGADILFSNTDAVTRHVGWIRY